MTEASGDADPSEALKRQVGINNEKAELSATALNNVAVTLFSGGTVLPIVALSFPLATAPPRDTSAVLAIVVWGLVAAGRHWLARTVLNGIRWKQDRKSVV